MRSQIGEIQDSVLDAVGQANGREALWAYLSETEEKTQGKSDPDRNPE